MALTINQIRTLQSMTRDAIRTAETEHINALNTLAEWDRNANNYRAQYGVMYEILDHDERSRVDSAAAKIDEMRALRDALQDLYGDALRAAGDQIQ